MFIRLLKYSFLLTVSLIILAIGFVLISQQMFDPNTLPENYGKVDSKLFASKDGKQPLLVYFGGSEGGNSMAKSVNEKEREQYIKQGYAVLAIGYFGLKGIPKELDRISIDAIYQEIQEIKKNPNIDESCVAVMGGSKGAELALSLASKYSDINAAVSFAGSHVSFSSTSSAADGKTASFTFNDLPLPHVTVPAKAIPHMLFGDFRRAHEIALENTSMVESALIKVEDIKGPVLLISGEKDHVWPSAEMSDEVIRRLTLQKFSYPFKHIVVPNGDHFQPQSDYHPQALAFLNEYFKPSCDSYQPTFN